MNNPAEKQLLLASPRGFCAGVRRAVAIVEEVLQRRPDKPVYVFHEIVHNTKVVQDFTARGVIFVNSIAEIPAGEVVIFSAHGVSKEVENEAGKRGLTVIDATCPLVSALHSEAIKKTAAGEFLVLIGHPEHPETIGTLGRIADQQMAAVAETAEDVKKLNPPPGCRISALTQTTLNNTAIAPVLEELQKRFGYITLSNRRCYATENRQNAVKMIAEQSELVLIIGSKHSSNSRELCKVAQNAGCEAILIDSPDEIPFERLESISTIGLSAGASAPPELVDNTLQILSQKGFSATIEVGSKVENVTFPLPQTLSEL